MRMTDSGWASPRWMGLRLRRLRVASAEFLFFVTDRPSIFGQDFNLAGFVGRLRDILCPGPPCELPRIRPSETMRIVMPGKTLMQLFSLVGVRGYPAKLSNNKKKVRKKISRRSPFAMRPDSDAVSFQGNSQCDDRR